MTLPRSRTQTILVAAATIAVLAVGVAVVLSRVDGGWLGFAGRGREAQEEGAMVQVRVFNRAGELVGPFEVAKLALSDAEWQQRLTPDQFRILRSSGTERPFCGVLLDNKQTGVYACGGCGLPLFTSDSKFNSGTGWPSFFQPIAKENVAERTDHSHGMARVEINCARCDGHLGHVFPDGPRPTGLRYCLNSESLVFTASDKLSELADAAAGD